MGQEDLAYTPPSYQAPTNADPTGGTHRSRFSASNVPIRLLSARAQSLSGAASRLYHKPFWGGRAAVWLPQLANLNGPSSYSRQLDVDLRLFACGGLHLSWDGHGMQGTLRLRVARVVLGTMEVMLSRFGECNPRKSNRYGRRSQGRNAQMRVESLESHRSQAVKRNISKCRMASRWFPRVVVAQRPWRSCL